MLAIASLNRRLDVVMARARPNALRGWIDRLNQVEIGWVLAQNALTRHRLVRSLVLVVNVCGDGWIYVLITAWLLIDGRPKAVSTFGAAVAAALTAQVLYAFVKAWVARSRPGETHTSVRVVGRPLDLYSFPSGHCMTSVAVIVVLGHSYPGIVSPGAVSAALISWVRVASGQHYPTDILSGAAIGVGVALPIASVVAL
jgi:undecaprenyl-diphosphatase